MALSADQRAMLELLLGRGQSYEDLSSLLGTSSDEVRSKARWALAELGGADPDRNVGLTDYLLGQADPIGRADAVRHLRDDAADRELAERLVAALGEIAPAAELPKLPAEGRSAAHLRPSSLGSRPRAAAGPQAPLSQRTKLMLGLGGGAVVLVLVVLLVTGGSGGDGGTSTASTTTSAGTTTTPTTPASGTTSSTPTSSTPSQTITPIKLAAVGGGPGSGAATFGLATGDTPFLDVRIDGLPPAPAGQVYAAWLVLDIKKRVGYPLAPLVPYPQSGPYHDTFNIPSLATPLIRSIQSVDITQTSDTALQKEIKGVLNNPKNPKIVLPEIGSTVLRGVVPRGSGGASSGK